MTTEAGTQWQSNSALHRTSLALVLRRCLPSLRSVFVYAVVCVLPCAMLPADRLLFLKTQSCSCLCTCIDPLTYTLTAQGNDLSGAFQLLDPFKHVYTTSEYSACPTIRHFNGFFYVFTLFIWPVCLRLLRCCGYDAIVWC